jgi:AAA family ATP:ADP antiporter
MPVRPHDPSARQKTWLDRSLALVTDVRAGEGPTALLLAANIFCIIAFYSVLKVVRDSLILSEGGAVAASSASAGQALILLAAVPLYSVIASRVNRLRLVCGVTLFFASHLVLFYLAGAAGARIGYAFYLWAGVFNLVVTAQFWAFTNDIYSSERGKRLFPLVGLGASTGAFVGAGLTYLGFSELGPYRLMLVAAAGLMLPIALTLGVHRREGGASNTTAASAEKPLEKSGGGFQLVLRNRYLLLIALLMVAVNLINTLGGFLLNSIIVREATAAVAAGSTLGIRELTGQMSAGIQTWVNFLGLMFQAFLVSRIFKYVGVRGALFILPLISLVGYSLIALIPAVAVVRVVKILENSTDYSIQSTTRNALFLPTSREAKYKAKQAIDSFFWRAGDLLQFVVVSIGTALALTLQQFALVNAIFAVALVGIVIALFREHKSLTEPAEATERAA